MYKKLLLFLYLYSLQLFPQKNTGKIPLFFHFQIPYLSTVKNDFRYMARTIYIVIVFLFAGSI